jgi:hypothetical protein
VGRIIVSLDSSIVDGEVVGLLNVEACAVAAKDQVLSNWTARRGLPSENVMNVLEGSQEIMEMPEIV